MKVVQVLHELKFSGAEIMYVDASHISGRKGVNCRYWPLRPTWVSIPAILKRQVTRCSIIPILADGTLHHASVTDLVHQVVDP